jgi:hypothetical protein
MLLVDVVDMFGATRVGTAIRYLITELERIRRREHVVDMHTVSLSATWMLGTGCCVLDVIDIEKPAGGNSVTEVIRHAVGAPARNAIPCRYVTNRERYGSAMVRLRQC